MAQGVLILRRFVNEPPACQRAGPSRDLAVIQHSGAIVDPITAHFIEMGRDRVDGVGRARFTVLAATKKPDGTLEANRINVGRDGVVPQ
jgi:hypothetical protein